MHTCGRGRWACADGLHAQVERIRAGPAAGGKAPEQMSPQEMYAVLWQVLKFRDSGASRAGAGACVRAGADTCRARSGQVDLGHDR
jgi:hypothetical protein